MKKRIFTFPDGMPNDAELVEHLLKTLAKDAPNTLKDARAEITVQTANGARYRAASFIET